MQHPSQCEESFHMQLESHFTTVNSHVLALDRVEAQGSSKPARIMARADVRASVHTLYPYSFSVPFSLATGWRCEALVSCIRGGHHHTSSTILQCKPQRKRGNVREKITNLLYI